MEINKYPLKERDRKVIRLYDMTGDEREISIAFSVIFKKTKKKNNR